ncbi:MAG: hypothetical protein IPG49_00210 [Proteobacteria bacterium]|nr:hypothetical protein [Pseudomonadota bacterium]
MARAGGAELRLDGGHVHAAAGQFAGNGAQLHLGIHNQGLGDQGRGGNDQQQGQRAFHGPTISAPWVPDEPRPAGGWGKT